jgi:hypothetical protein
VEDEDRLTDTLEPKLDTQEDEQSRPRADSGEMNTAG